MSSDINNKSEDFPQPSSSRASSGPANNSSHRGRRQRPPKRTHSQGPGSRPVTVIDSKRALVESSRSTVPLKQKFLIYLSTNRLFDLVSTVHSYATMRDSNLQQNLTISDFYYVANQFAIFKILKSDMTCGNFDDEYYALQTTLQAVSFPSPICDYIDSIGSVKMSNGITVTPSLTGLLWDVENGENFLSRRTPLYMQRNFVHPAMLIEGMRVPQWYTNNFPEYPKVGYHPNCNGKWKLMPDVVSRYLAIQPRMEKTLEMRKPAMHDEGQTNILVSFAEDFDSVQCFSPQVVPDEVAQIGALFGWNDKMFYDAWGLDTKALTPWTQGLTFSRTSLRGQWAQKGMKPFVNH